MNWRRTPHSARLQFRVGTALKGAAVLIFLAAIFAPYSHAQTPASGQTTAPISGGIGLATRPNPFQGMTGTYAPAHKTPDGRACISVHPMTHPQIINPKIIDQIIIVSNICGQSIKVRACYAGSSDCITVPLSGYQKVQRTLGVASGSTTFRYEYREVY